MKKQWFAILVLGWLLAGCVSMHSEFKTVKASSVPTPAGAEENWSLLASTPTPAVTVVVAAPDLSPQEYWVRPGDSLWRISRRFYHDPAKYKELLDLNQIKDADLIHPGQVLLLPPIGSFSGLAQPAAAGVSPTAAEAVPPQPTPVPLSFPRVPNPAFKVGEKLTFSVEYFGIAAGFATLSVLPAKPINGRPVFLIEATARTHSAFEWFFKVTDRIVSYLDQEGIFSWQYEKHLREGGYSNDSVLIYDQPQRRVIKDEGRTIVPAPAWCQDVLSEFYYFRTQPLKLGQDLSIPVVADNGKTFEVIVKVLRRERVSVPTGTYDCLVVEPQVKFESVFKNTGKIEIWVTDDEHKVPVLIKSQIVIGTIDVVLRDAVVVAD